MLEITFFHHHCDYGSSLVSFPSSSISLLVTSEPLNLLAAAGGVFCLEPPPLPPTSDCDDGFGQHFDCLQGSSESESPGPFGHDSMQSSLSWYSLPGWYSRNSERVRTAGCPHHKCPMSQTMPKRYSLRNAESSTKVALPRYVDAKESSFLQAFNKETRNSSSNVTTTSFYHLQDAFLDATSRCVGLARLALPTPS